MKLDKPTMKRLLLLMCVGVVLAWGLDHLSSIRNAIQWLLKLLSTFTTGLVIAFILNIIVSRLEKGLLDRIGFFAHGRRLAPLKRVISIAVSILSVLLVLAGVVLVILPQFGQTYQTLAKYTPRTFAELREFADGLVARFPQLDELNLEIDWAKMQSKLLDFLENRGTALLGSTIGIVVGLIGGIIQFTMSLIFAIYVLARKEILASQFRRVMLAYLPDRVTDRILYIAELSSKTFANFVSGQCIEAIIIGVMFVVAMYIFRFPYPITIPVVIAVTALIPIFGAYLGLALGDILILVTDPILAVWFTVMFIIIQQIEGNVIYPRVVGQSVGLPAIWVLFAVTIGGSLFGVVGMLVMVPLASVVYSLFRDEVNVRLQKKNAAKQSPVPAKTK